MRRATIFFSLLHYATSKNAVLKPHLQCSSHFNCFPPTVHTPGSWAALHDWAMLAPVALPFYSCRLTSHEVVRCTLELCLQPDDCQYFAYVDWILSHAVNDDSATSEDLEARPKYCDNDDDVAPRAV
jgi:hypothetical protein